MWSAGISLITPDYKWSEYSGFAICALFSALVGLGFGCGIVIGMTVSFLQNVFNGYLVQ